MKKVLVSLLVPSLALVGRGSSDESTSVDGVVQIETSGSRTRWRDYNKWNLGENRIMRCRYF